MKTIVTLSDITFDQEEERAVVEVLRSRWISSGEVTREFEREFGEHVGASHVVAVTNCTAALHLALLAVGLGPGDEVLVPSLTFVATVNAIRYTGARPVFVDIVDLDDWDISPDAIREQITPRTRAIVPMHYSGFPCDMKAIGEIARENGLYVVEDAAHGPGSWIGAKHIGTFGDVGCFSFFANKNMTTAEGGVAVTDSPELAQKLRHLRSHGMSTLSWDRHQARDYRYEVLALGFNYRFDEIRAALGRVQLKKLAGNNRKRAELYARYLDLLKDVSGVRIPFRGRRGRFSHNFFPVLLDEEVDRAGLINRLQEQGVQTSMHYPPVHLMSIHRDLEPESLLFTEAVGRREVTLPLHPLLGLEDIDYVVEKFRECM
jgi:dTDP-4-amino-4,6-dideoxygalactose transaminase